ncbi:MarR family winged helix-turn-helix transcriptional regulator [Glutamicibacter sp. PAEs-4]|uniref:MarR family winged helix-turn-helix transcriptional regulator n=1 Tax=unclassified Glutamicibacter TaxID=2627139 RepID=UPI0011F3FF1E|nr:MarR family transcriptional regulator [Glutamicibacter sp. ZJUTW]QEP06298.1 MarR family transcriptional regulator [Glutamicibacter sp. ZJUTW]
MVKSPDSHSDSELKSLLDELARSSRILRVFSHMDQTDPEVSNASHHVLKTLKSREPTHAADLAQVLGIGTAAMSRHLAELEQSGLVDRRPSQIDARRHVLWVTEAGCERLEFRDRLRLERMRQVLPDWDSSRMASVAHALGELNDTMIRGIQSQRTDQFGTEQNTTGNNAENTDLG